MDNEELSKSVPDLDGQKLKNTPSFLAAEDQKRETRIVWNVIPSEYDSGPKIGID